MLRLLPPLAAFLFFALAPLQAPQSIHAAEAPAYIAMGDSLAFGVGAQNPAAEGYVALTANALLLNERFSGSGLDLVNISEPGATSADIVASEDQLEKALEEIATRKTDAEPDNDVQIISIDIGGNDLLTLAEPDSPCFDEPAGALCRTLLNAMLSDLQQNLTRTLTELRQAVSGAEIYVIDLYNPYSGTGESLEIIAGIGVQMVNGVLAAVSADPQLGVRFVSVYELFQGRGEQWVATDHIHPSNDGHRVMAEALTASIEGRNIVIPPDIAQLPSASPSAASSSGGDGDGVSLALFLAALAAAFAGGGLVSAAYFLVRGRP
ncbi:MAG: GDSL-type esterase/lipase family protein [Dehalococcoidia bacterium]